LSRGTIVFAAGFTWGDAAACRFGKLLNGMDTKIVKKRRRRVKQELPLRLRLLKSARAAREKADRLPPGEERLTLLKKARQAEIVADFEVWLSTPGLPAPK
jgi:hypothetical protein